MGPDASTLNAADLQCFHDDGYLIVRGAFARDDALAMQAAWWRELADTYGILRDDRATWRRILADLKRPKSEPHQHTILTPRVEGVINDLLGTNTWERPKDWGRSIVTFPEPGGWDVPTDLWHWDSAVELHGEALNALFVVSFVGEVVPCSGGTLILSGSHRLLKQYETALTPEARRGKPERCRRLLYGSHPWLAALAGLTPSPPNRIATFMEASEEIEGIPLRMVELTGQPGDMEFCHPTIIHCVSPNHGTQPRMMRIKQQLLTLEGARQVNGATPAA